MAATVLIFIRSIYRVAELWEGFGGKLANDEATFMIFEGPMIILAVTAMTVFHPGRIFGDLWVPAGQGVGSMGKAGDEQGSSVPLTGMQWNQSVYQRVDRAGSEV